MASREERERAEHIFLEGLNVWNVNEKEFPQKGKDRDKLKFLLNYAILAPSTYNEQPWIFLLKRDKIEIYIDRSRILSVVDPDGRQMAISCGVAVHFLKRALHYFGYQGDIAYFPEDPTGDLVATIGLGEVKETTNEDREMFHAIFTRRTNRNQFDSDRSISQDILRELIHTVEEINGQNVWAASYSQSSNKRKLAQLVKEADKRQRVDKSFAAERASWIHPYRKSSNDGMPTYALTATQLLKKGNVRLVGKHSSSESELAGSSSALFIIGTSTDDFKSWVLAGEALGRILLLTTKHGIQHSYLSQVLEIPSIRRKVAALVEKIDNVEEEEEILELTASCHPQIILRLGYGSSVSKPTPRKAVIDCIRLEPPLYEDL